MRAGLLMLSALLLICPSLLAEEPSLRPAPGEVVPAESPPVTAQETRNWLLAHLLTDYNFDADRLHGVEAKLAAMSPDQLDVLTRVYEERYRQRAAVQQTQLDEAKANLARRRPRAIRWPRASRT